MRHVGNILVQAIATGTPINWEAVHSKRDLKGTASNLSAAHALEWEKVLKLPTKSPTPDYQQMVHPTSPLR